MVASSTGSSENGQWQCHQFEIKEGESQSWQEVAS